jgi:hypothetical protein
MKVIFVGMHNKKDKCPLCSSTRSGKLIDRICRELTWETQKTNLYDVDYYPTTEDEKEFHAYEWHRRIQPGTTDIIVLLGQEVHNHFFNALNYATIKLAHPSSVWSKEHKAKYVMTAVNLLAPL